MKRKIIAIIAAAVLIAAGTLIFHELLRPKQTEPPEPVFSTHEAPINTTAESTSAVQEETGSPTDYGESGTSQESPHECSTELYTSHDPLHSFRICFSGKDISVEGIYEGDTVSLISLESVGNVRAGYKDGIASAHITTEQTSGIERLYIRFESGGYIPVFISYDENGNPQPYITEAMEITSKAANHLIIIPAENAADYIVTDGSEAERAAVLLRVSELSRKICSGLTADYDKARAIADWVSRNIYYDFDSYDSGVTVQTLSLARTLELQRSVCGGYANLYAALCQSQGLTCYVVKGAVVQGGGTFGDGVTEATHEWNLLELDGRHIWVDTLWNTDNAYIDSEYFFGDQHYRYFDISEECLSVNHRAQRVELHSFY